MIVSLFRNLVDFKWLLAAFILFALFLPMNSAINNGVSESALLLNDTTNAIFLFRNTFIAGLISAVFIILLAVIFNFTLISHKIVPGRNFLGLMYAIILMSLWLRVLPGIAELIPVLLIILAVMPVFSSEGSAQPQLRIFDASFIISIACLFSLTFLPFILVPFVALVLFRQVSWKLWVSALTGICIPQVFLITGLFVFSDNMFYFQKFSDFFNSMNFTVINFTSFPFHWYVFGPVLVFSLFRTINMLGEKKIIVRKKMILLIWLLLISVLLLFFSQVHFKSLILFISILSGFFISGSLQFLYEKRLFALLTDLSVPAIVFSHFFL